MKRILLFLVLLTFTFTLIGCETKEIEIGDNVFVIVKYESGEGEQQVVTYSIIEGIVKKVQTYNGVLEFIVADKKLIPRKNLKRKHHQPINQRPKQVVKLSYEELH